MDQNILQYLEGLKSYERLSPPAYNKGFFNLNRFCRFLKLADINFAKLNFIHVAGSKGKGSVCTFLNQYYLLKGRQVGLYTSPHLLNLRERIKLNNEMISQPDFAKNLQFLRKVLDKSNLEITFFEFLTALALRFFALKNPDIILWEVGMGGLLDATNVVRPICCVITGIEKEHTNILGNSIEEILQAKLGIVKNGVPVFVGRQSKTVLEKIKKLLKNHQEKFFVDDLRQKNALVQADNFLLCKLILQNIDSTFDLGIFNKTARNFRFPGRFDIKKIKNKTVIFDIAHTPKSVEALMKSVNFHFPGKKIRILAAFLQDKQIVGIFNIFKKFTSEIILSEVKNVRSQRVDDLGNVLKVRKENLIGDLKKAFFQAWDLTLDDEILVVTGSNYLVAEIFSAAWFKIWLN